MTPGTPKDEMIPAQGPSHKVALIGASSLKGKEVKEVLADRPFPLGPVALFDAEKAAGQLTDLDDEPTIIQPVTAETFAGSAFAIFASSPDFTKRHWQLAEAAGCQLIDLSYFLETDPGAHLRSPAVAKLLAEEEEPQPTADSRLHVPAHPAAAAIASLLLLLSRRFEIRQSAITVFEPASEKGQAGVDELHQQALSLFSFQQIPQKVFDCQVAFNLLASLGPGCQAPLREIQDRVFRHTQVLLADRVPPPAVRLLQAPVFHGGAFSCFVELEESAASEELEEALGRSPFVVCRDADTPPSPVSAAGSGDILLGPVESSPASDTGFWIWGVMDNLRWAALSAVEIAENVIAAGAAGEDTGGLSGETLRPL